MKKKVILFSLVGLSLTGCSTIDESMRAMEANRQAIDYSTCVINQNTQAIEQDNAAIAENRRQLQAINETLGKIKEESK